MFNAVNNEIFKFIDKSDFDENVKKFLKEAILLEFYRNKKKKSHYFNEYDGIVEKYVGR